MRKFYFTLIFLVFGFLVSAQTSSEVGVTEGQLSVSLSGAANYTIPIAVPPGINGVVPQISLAYNSQGGVGLAGYGWNILGVSAITRIPATMFHDGVIDPVDFNDLDRLALDDKRLILKSTEKFDIAATKRIYETEIFSNLKITYYKGYTQNNSQDIVLSPIDYFIVEYTDGSSAKYESHGSATDWTISSWENPQGVFISYEYNSQYTGFTSPSNNAVIEKIKYGSLKSKTQINEIQFVYKSRSRAEQAYIGGKSFIRDKILSDITIKSNGLGFRNYSLTHDLSSFGYERLKTITEKSGDNSKSFSPTVFSYQENQTAYSPSIESTSTGKPFHTNNITQTLTGDFDGDGENELMTNENGVTISKILDDYSVEKISSISFQSLGITRVPTGIINVLDDNLKMSSKQSVYTSERVNGYDERIKIFTYNSISKQLEFAFQRDFQSILQPNLRQRPVGDFNGDNITDMIAIFGDVNGISPVKFLNLDRRVTSDFIVDIGTIDIGIKTFYFVPDVSNGLAVIGGTSVFQTGDINGDGKSDLIVFRGNPYNDIRVYTLVNNALVEIVNYKINLPGDIGSDFFQQHSVYNTTIAGTGMQRFPIVIGDFNGDGKSDIFLVAQKKALISTGGKTFIEEAVPSSFANVEYPYSESFIVADYNNDGKDDIIQLKPLSKKYQNPYVNYDYGIKINACYRSGTNGGWKTIDFEKYLTLSSNDPNPLDNNSFNFMVYSSVRKNKSNPLKTDLALIGAVENSGNAKISVFQANNFLSNQNLINSITLGNGVKESITYVPLKDGNGIYNAGNSQVYPNLDMKFNPGFQVVSQLDKQSSSQYKKQLFRYYGAITNLEGLGFLGFASTVKTNWHNYSSPVISYISRNDMSLRGANIENYAVLGMQEPLKGSPNQTETNIIKKDNYTVTGTEDLVATQSIALKPDTWIKPGSTFSAKINSEATNASIDAPSSFITKSLLTYESELATSKVFKIKNTYNEKFNGLEDTSIETTTTYDEYNNPKKVTTVIKESKSEIQKSVTDIAYESNTTPYIVGRPTSKIQNVTLGTDKMTTEEVYRYNSNQLLDQIQKKGDATTSFITEDNAYDIFGNIIKKSIKAGSDTRETSFEYDSSGRFLTKNTDVEKLVTTYEYNANGTLKSKTNPYKQKMSYEYDAWFKKIKETDYLNNITTYKYVNVNRYISIAKTFADGSGFDEIFDDLGRKIATGSKNIMGSNTYVSYEYDIQDRNYKVSEPYINGASSLWNETKYDDYGQVNETVSATGKTTTIVTTGLTTTVNDGVKTTTYIKNALGSIVSMYDVPSNKIKYTYFANGNLKESDYDGVKTKITQDGWGRKIQIEDPSAGIFKYKYNDFGDLISEENKNGITSYKINSTGKIEEKTISGINTNSKMTYTYNENQLISNVEFKDFTNESNVITTEYIYDQSQRISKKTETTPYAVFTKDYKYNSFEKLDKETYTASRLGKSSTKTLRYTYRNGALNQIIDNGNSTILWQSSTVNAYGQFLSVQTGPSITAVNSYDVYGYLVQLKYNKTIGTNIFTLSTNFDVKKGNLDDRTNGLFSWKESFKYDNLDRLTEYTNIKGINELQAYDDKGRIKQNNLGTYSYVKENPYQNEAITVTPQALSYYTVKPSQIIDYNVFKGPVVIDEKDVDKVSFDYNSNNSRTASFYGGLQVNKLERIYHKYYSEDGTMEIKENSTTGVLDFVTYIGGDVYTAPIVFKSDGITTSKYLFLHRDYQSSIIAITDITGAIVEKRVFDAWGNIGKVQDGAGNTLAGLTVLDRGYTGHEHIQSVGLINMNGRLYDPQLHRFLQPDNNIQDPFNTQNYNRYGYVLNNPLRYTDPSGESILGFALGFIFSTYVHGGVASGGQINPFKWSHNDWQSAFAGAASSVGSFYASSTASGFANNYLDNYNNKPVLGASAVGQWDNTLSFVNNGYISITQSEGKREGVGVNTIPCVACHHTLDSGEIFSGAQSKFGNGLQNTVFGVVGTIGAVGAIPETAGGSGLALTLTIGQVSIGMAQMVDSFNDRPDTILHDYSTIPGLIAAKKGSKYAPMIDFTSAWMTGSVNSPNLLGNYNGFRYSVNRFSQGKNILYNGISIYSTYSTVNSGVSSSLNLIKY